MAKLKSYIWDKIAPGLVGGVIGVLLTAILIYFVPAILQTYRENFKNEIIKGVTESLAKRFGQVDTNIDAVSRDIGDIKTKLAVLETKVDNLDRQVFRQFRARAMALGIANPQISLINLKEKETKHIIQYFLKDPQGNDLGVITATLRVLAVEKDTVLMALDQTSFDYTTMKEMIPAGRVMEFRVPLQITPPILLKLRLKIGNQEAPPAILKLAVIDRPSPDLLVLAIGTPSQT